MTTDTPTISRRSFEFPPYWTPKGTTKEREHDITGDITNLNKLSMKMKLYLPCWNHFSQFHTLFISILSQSIINPHPHKLHHTTTLYSQMKIQLIITLNLTPLMPGRVYVQRRWSDCVSDESRRAFTCHHDKFERCIDSLTFLLASFQSFSRLLVPTRIWWTSFPWRHVRAVSSPQTGDRTMELEMHCVFGYKSPIQTRDFFYYPSTEHLNTESWSSVRSKRDY